MEEEADEQGKWIKKNVCLGGGRGGGGERKQIMKNV